jgi:hypothetical protein
MSNHDDFWTTLATGHSNTVLAGAMDSHLSGKSIEESFGSVRTLTDTHRAANALVLPVAAGTKVAFAGNIGAYMSYDDVPADGILGEVVTVRSATGEITHHDGKVFVKWADGKFRPVHAEHLRLASEGKTASDIKAQFEGQKSGVRSWEVRPASALKSKKDRDKGGWVVVFTPTGEFIERADTKARAEAALSAVLTAVPEIEYARKNTDLTPFLRAMARAQRRYGSDIKQQFEKIKALAEKRPDSDFLKSILKQMADKGFAPTDKQMAVVKKIEGEIKQQGEMKKELAGLDKKGGRKVFNYEDFGSTIEFAEELGWKDVYGDGEDDDYDADAVEEEALDYIKRKGYRVKMSGFSPKDIGKKQNGPLTSDPEDKKIMDHFGQGDLHEMTEVANDKTATFRVASLGDLTDFLKVASGALVHKSTKDLWSYSKDADGNFLVSRLFDDEGEPLKV